MHTALGDEWSGSSAVIPGLLLAVAVVVDSTAAPPRSVERLDSRVGISATPVQDSTDAKPRPRSIAISDSYDWKFRAHRIGSYFIIPLFAAQYAMGSELLEQKEDVYFGRRTESVNGTLRTAHLATAIGVGTVFLANSVTGPMLLYENRGNQHNRKLRLAHAAMMLAADAGFVATGIMGRRALEQTPDYARKHRQVALGSIGVATTSAAMMWIFNR